MIIAFSSVSGRAHHTAMNSWHSLGLTDTTGPEAGTALALTQFSYLENADRHKASRVLLSGQDATELESLALPHVADTRGSSTQSVSKQVGCPPLRSTSTGKPEEEEERSPGLCLS